MFPLFFLIKQICEEVRKSLEHCEVDSDIHLFISMKQTGMERPGKLAYKTLSNTLLPSFSLLCTVILE